MSELMIEFKTGPVNLTDEALVAIGGLYQVSFAGEPWRESSRCAAPKRKLGVCPGGFSPLEVGEMCIDCGLSPLVEAYPMDELTKSLNSRFADTSSQLYLESEDSELLLAAIFWEARPKKIAGRKYADMSEMEKWLIDNLPDQPIVWLDEIFADKQKRPTGNLWNYQQMIEKVLEKAGSKVIAFRTINEGLLAKTKSVFPSNSTVIPGKDIPDDRDRTFVIIDGRWQPPKKENK